MTEPLRFADVRAASLPGSADKPSEDWSYASQDFIAVLDGATARTDIGCVHGVHWYAERLGLALVDLAANPNAELAVVLEQAITRVANEHPQCDLTHPGTPSAGVAMVRSDGRYLVLGDVTIVADSKDTLVVVVDPRVENTGRAERDEVDRHLIGTPEKAAALIPMKKAELAARNVPGGYWIAAADPQAAHHALTGQIGPHAGARIGVLSDGAARAETFGLLSWPELLALMATEGPTALLARVRQAEAEDPLGVRWPRNKASDDATAVVAGWQ